MARTLWELVEITKGVDGQDKPAVRIFSDGYDAIVAFIGTKKKAVLLPVQVRVTADSKALSAKGEAHYISLTPVAIEHLTHEANVQPASDKLSRAMDLVHALQVAEAQQKDDDHDSDA